MEKIVKIERYIVKEKLKESFYFSQKEYDQRNICIVKVISSSGKFGWGEGYGPAHMLEAGINLIEPMVIGNNALENEVIWNKMYRETLDFARRGILVSAISAIDVAIWDLKGKILGLPVSVLLGGQQRKSVRPYATGLYFTAGENPSGKFESEALSYLEKGFKAIKMKVGIGIREDVKNVRKVRKAIGDNIKLMVDSNHAYSYTEATELARKIEPYDISWFEEPVSPEFYNQYKLLRQHTNIPIAGGECEYLRFGFHQLLRNESVDIIQPDICGCGGLTEAKKIAALASSYGADIIPHTWGSGIGLHAALHFIANLENIPGRMFSPDYFMEFDQTENPLRDLLTLPKLEMKNGMIDVPAVPGLGVEVDEDMLAHYTSSKEKETIRTNHL